jgi:hypothetical protein
LLCGSAIRGLSQSSLADDAGVEESRATSGGKEPMHWRRLAAATCGALTVGTAAHANRPLNTDTADTIEAGQCQFEPYAGTNRASGSPAEDFTVLQLNCGVPRETQLGVALARAAAAGASSEGLVVGGKTSWGDPSSAPLGLAIGYGLGWTRDDGAPWARDTASINLIVSHQAAAGLLVHANLGTQHSRLARQSSTTWAVATEWSVGASTTLSAEAYGDDRSRPWVSTGAVWSPADRVTLNLSFGSQTSTPRVRQFTAGFNLQF